jgi:hypothetical protein
LATFLNLFYEIKERCLKKKKTLKNSFFLLKICCLDVPAKLIVGESEEVGLKRAKACRKSSGKFRQKLSKKQGSSIFRCFWINFGVEKVRIVGDFFLLLFFLQFPLLLNDSNHLLNH